MNNQHIRDLKNTAGNKAVMTESKVIKVMSKDHCWFSPVLKPQLEHKLGKVIVQPTTLNTLKQVVAHAFENEIPITTRGSGTGNYQLWSGNAYARRH